MKPAWPRPLPGLARGTGRSRAAFAFQLLFWGLGHPQTRVPHWLSVLPLKGNRVCNGLYRLPTGFIRVLPSPGVACVQSSKLVSSPQRENLDFPSTTHFHFLLGWPGTKVQTLVHRTLFLFAWLKLKPSTWGPWLTILDRLLQCFYLQRLLNSMIMPSESPGPERLSLRHHHKKCCAERQDTSSLILFRGLQQNDSALWW